MSEMKHTPGPWRVVTEDESIGSVEAADGSAVAQAQIRRSLSKPNHEERRANACLIAAAPSLLDACEAHQAFEAHAKDCGDCDEWGAGNCQEGHRLYSVACDSINEAIAKAKGES